MNADKFPYEIVTLEESWVNKTFPQEFLELLKKYAREGQYRFLKVPVADKIRIVPTMDISNNPLITFRNTDDGICAFASLASALWFLHWQREANRIMDFCSEFKHDQDGHRVLAAIVEFIQ